MGRSGPRLRYLAAFGAVTLALAAVAAGAPGGHGAPEEAEPMATFTSGSFTQFNSRNGTSIFSTGNLAPGDTATGVVTIANTGTLGGHFTLSAHDVADAPGPNGGLLSSRLQVTVQDLTAPGSPVTVSAGSPAAMTARPLGHFRAGDVRTYRFTARLPDGGLPPSPTAGDNAFAGSSTSVRYRWDAVESSVAGGRPPRPGASSTPRDRRPPRLRLAIPAVQRVDSRGYLVLRARCNEACRIAVAGTVRVGRGRPVRMRPPRSRRLAPGRSTRVRVWMPRRWRGAALRSALLKDSVITVRLRVVARDRAGNRATARRTIRLSRR